MNDNIEITKPTSPQSESEGRAHVALIFGLLRALYFRHYQRVESTVREGMSPAYRRARRAGPRDHGQPWADAHELRAFNKANQSQRARFLLNRAAEIWLGITPDCTEIQFHVLVLDALSRGAPAMIDIMAVPQP